jgi:aspartyl-tRNA(Asn)/glutamyl-tRNA(Gln) amidotransferase subunit B
MSSIYDKYEPVIGLEIHAQMKTESKAFCRCSTQFNSPANSNVCPVCLGHPGTLPVLNRKLVEYILKMGLATNCSIRERSIFARKNYFYPDLSKGYQITQFETPICYGGCLDIELKDKSKKSIGITRIHMEEDAGKSIHDFHEDDSLVDFNRCGVPLIEIVSEPDMRSTDEAYQYLNKIKQILLYLDINDGNMEEGSLRCDANISVMPKGSDKFGTRTEIKNLNSFKNVTDAIEAEIRRQVDLIESGGKVFYNTMTYNAKDKTTFATRTKEEAHDYRYFPEPDLVYVHVTEEWKNSINESLPEFPDAKKERFIVKFGLPEYDAEVLTHQKEISEYYENVLEAYEDKKNLSYKLASNWVMGEVMRVLNDEKIHISEFKISPGKLAKLLSYVASGQINNNSAKEVFAVMTEDASADPEGIIKEKNLIQVTDTSEIENIIKGILAKNSDEVIRYKAGEKKLLGFLVGVIMRESKGKANPKLVNELLLKNLEQA